MLNQSTALFYLLVVCTTVWAFAAGCGSSPDSGNENGESDTGADDETGLIPFIDNEVFEFRYGDVDAGERIIDAQYASSTKYVSTTMNGNETLFGVNFADGRIKGYPATNPMFEVKYVRGNPDYGVNDFKDNGDDTVTDRATGLMWTCEDSGEGLNWEEALAWVADRNEELFLGHDDWRLPNAKELQSIVDYTRSPETDDSPAIDPVFTCTPITNEAGDPDYGHYWAGTTHISANGMGSRGCYVCFGRCMGKMGSWIDVHGAGAQRSDFKQGDPDDYPDGLGPQGDAIRIYNFVRMVRDAS